MNVEEIIEEIEEAIKQTWNIEWQSMAVFNVWSLDIRAQHSNVLNLAPDNIDSSTAAIDRLTQGRAIEIESGLGLAEQKRREQRKD